MVGKREPDAERPGRVIVVADDVEVADSGDGLFDRQLPPRSRGMSVLRKKYDREAETTIGLYKTEAIRDDSPFRRGALHRLADVELLTAEWVHWYNSDRLMHRLDRIPPVEYEAIHYATKTAQTGAAHQ